MPPRRGWTQPSRYHPHDAQAWAPVPEVADDDQPGEAPMSPPPRGLLVHLVAGTGVILQLAVLLVILAGGILAPPWALRSDGRPSRLPRLLPTKDSTP